MLRGSVFVETQEDLMDVYNLFVNSSDFDLIQVKNEFNKPYDSEKIGYRKPFNRVILYLIFNNGIICEIKLIFGKQPV